MLAQIEAVMYSNDLPVLAIDDIKSAFPSVTINHILDDHRRYINDQALLTLIEVVLRGSDPTRTRGIDQGSAYSPTALNVRLHHALDHGVKHDQLLFRYYRYADNLVFACRNMLVGHEALERARLLFEPAGFTLKGEDGPPKDLRKGEEVQLLGFTLSYKEDRLQYNLSTDAWFNLEKTLIQAHQTHNPPLAAKQAVNGWIEAFGPVFETVRVHDLDRILQTARKLGFREVTSPEDLADRCETAWRRWVALKGKTPVNP
jgi:hypothetical protein